jgi:hypothetical protein
MMVLRRSATRDHVRRMSADAKDGADRGGERGSNLVCRSGASELMAVLMPDPPFRRLEGARISDPSETLSKVRPWAG